MTCARAWLVPVIAAVAAAPWLAGCAGLGTAVGPPAGPGAARTPAGTSVAPQAAFEAISVGTSTRADVAAALGTAIVVPFDSGYEVWVYRWPGVDTTSRMATELVVLFAPSGRATKVRLRPPSAPRD